MASGANTHFTFGHYEQAIGHFHRHLTAHVEMLKAPLLVSGGGEAYELLWRPSME